MNAGNPILMMRRTGLRKWLVGFVILLIGVSLYLAGEFRKPEIIVPRLDGTTMTVVPGIHLLGGLGPSAAYVVETSAGHVLIDTGLETDAKALKAQMTSLNLDWNQLKAIFITHVHGDHCGGAERLRNETGARVYAGQADVPLLTSGEPREAFFSTFKMPGHSPHPTRIDVELQGGESVQIGNTRFQILNTPGHTPGSTCYLVEQSGLRILFSGDVIYRLGEKPLGTYSTYLAPRYRGDAQQYLMTLRKLKQLRIPDLVLPGHPGASRKAQTPRLTKREWDGMLDRGIEEMETLLDRFHHDGANFLDGIPKPLLPNLFYFGDHAGEAVYGMVSESRLFLINAPGGPGLVEFLNSQFGQLGVNSLEPFAVLVTSCGEKELAALTELVDRFGVRVVTAPGGVEIVKKRCRVGTIVISSDDLPDQNWIPLSPILLKGNGEASVAYLFREADKRVLFSGRFLRMIDSKTREEDLSNLGGHQVIDYLTSLRQLASVQPNLWLPSVTTDGQNANLYDGAWNAILEKNYNSVSQSLQRR